MSTWLPHGRSCRLARAILSVKCLQVSTHLVRVMLLELVLLEEMGFMYVMLLLSKLSKFTTLTSCVGWYVISDRQM